MHDNALPVGAVVSGRYRILKVLGQGGFGITYLVRDEYLATKLALKECFPEQCVVRDANGSQNVIPLPTKEELFHKLKEKFIGEARTIFGLHGDVHVEGIVHVYNVEEANNTGYMAMEYLDGETLESYLNAQGPVDCIWLLTLVKPVLLALQCIHTQGLLHRDIAPDNLMLIQKNGKEKLVLFDFGSVKEVAKGATTIMIAKPGYSPPEQFDPKTELTWATDIYALSATLYAMLGGSVPADATTRLSGIVLSRKDPLIELHELNAQIPQEVESIIAKGMQLDAAKRYQSANEMAEDVERFLKKKQSITVEYYYNSILGKTEYVQKQAHSRLDIEQLKTEEPDFVLSKTENLPLQVSFDDNENIVRLYYISRRTASCTIEYYYDDAVEKEILTGLIVGSQVSYQDKPKPEFFFDHAENAPLTVGKNADKNIIRVYYRSVANVTCKIEYYYDHKLDEAATLTFTGKVGDYFSYQGYEKPRDMYRFDCAKNDPLILSSNPEENIIRVYYSQKTVLLESNYIFHYCYDGIENTAEKTVQPLNGNDLDQAVAKHAREKENYRLVYQEVNSTSPGAVDITYYYESCKATEPQSSLSVKLSGEIRKNVNFAHRDAALGDVIRYTLNVTNTGNIDLKDIVVSILDEKSQCVYVSQAFSLQPGSQKKVSYQYTVEKHDALNEQVVMKAVASGNCPWSKKIVVAKADCTLKVRPLNKPNPKPHKATKRWWIALALLLVMAGCVAFFVPHLQTHDAEPQYAVGDYVTFGTYPQTAEGTDETPIEWLVLDKNGNKVLLLSRYGLDARPYHTEWKNITWENCTLRTWLNHDFMNRAFTAAEQSAILLTNVDNSSSQCYSEWSSKSGNNTQDKVFLLSYAEANKYLGVIYKDSNFTYSFDYLISSRAAPTAYAIGARAVSTYKTADGQDTWQWWLRSPGVHQNSAAFIGLDGFLYSFNVNDAFCVRPALWVNIALINDSEPTDKQIEFLAPIIDSTSTPAPTHTPTPIHESTPSAAPSKCQLYQTTAGIRIEWQRKAAGSEMCRIFRRENKQEPILLYTVPANRCVYLDTNVEPNKQYSYALQFGYKDNWSNVSEESSITWTEYSQLSNLEIWQDKESPRNLHASWDDVVEADYDIKVFLESDEQKDESYWLSTVDVREIEFCHAVPNATYRFTVTEPVTGQVLEKSFKTPKAKKYSQSKGAKLLWVNAKQLWEEHKDPWECDSIAYSAITGEKFTSMRKTYILYFVSNLTYTRQSDAHQVSEYYVLRGPNGAISSTDSGSRFFEEAPSNSWECWDEIFWQQFSPDQKITEPYGSDYTPEPGTYTLEQYFNDELVNSCQLKIKK